MSRNAHTAVPINAVLAERWSPRSFDATATLHDDDLTALLEAARWSPSGNNRQPWQFVIGRRGTPTFEKIHSALSGFNREWAPAASALVLAVAETDPAKPGSIAGSYYDLGLAVAAMSFQAQSMGLHTHQMAGFSTDSARAAFDLDEHLHPVTVTAVGRLGEASALSDPLRERELAPRTRKTLNDIVLERA